MGNRFVINHLVEIVECHHQETIVDHHEEDFLRTAATILVDHRDEDFLPIAVTIHEVHHDDSHPIVGHHQDEDGEMMDQEDHQDEDSLPTADLHHAVWTDLGVHQVDVVVHPDVVLHQEEWDRPDVDHHLEECRLAAVHHQDVCHLDVECHPDVDLHQDGHHQDHGDADHHHQEGQDEDLHQEMLGDEDHHMMMDHADQEVTQDVDHHQRETDHPHQEMMLQLRMDGKLQSNESKFTMKCYIMTIT